ncbi:nuclear transport factor 2 family protein [Nonomuraea sp. SBT364]|uniref:nuclear transport factor 2 family protein n=1 Tax=Nonomuraea sp. SBT364 TaxID=1580530 RepID=UPI00066C3A93|nr:nuclear transport factor 2 family protein [Nonomuraea sp. SBT364]
MAEHPNITIAGNSYDAMAKANWDYLRDELLADDVVFHVPGRGSLARDYRGKDEVLGYLKHLAQSTGDTLRMEPRTFLVGDDHVATMLRVFAERQGRVLEDTGLQVYRVTEGKISERWSYPDNPDAVDAFFTS